MSDEQEDTPPPNGSNGRSQVSNLCEQPSPWGTVEGSHVLRAVAEQLDLGAL